jgi:glycosyltransferase involved in cell wall biosynthesis
MKIGIVCHNFYPIPHTNHGGEFFILGLVHCLVEMGHDVCLFAPKGTKESGAKLYETPCSNGTMTPHPDVCEKYILDTYLDVLQKQDIIHDFSTNKNVAEYFYKNGKTNVICTLLGGDYTHPSPAYNVICNSLSMKARALRGASDYENLKLPNFKCDEKWKPLKDAHVVHCGINTDWYTPTYDKKDYFLWLGRWHEARGYREAIALAKCTGINLIMAGEHPDREVSQYQRNCAYQALDISADIPNIKFEWLPPDPDHHDRKRELYRGARALINTVQFHEPFGLQQPEAMACGTPVIGTNLGALSETITNGVTGYICDNTIEDFAQAIKLIDNIDPKICREHAAMRFDRHVMTKAYLAEYYSVINGKIWGK